MRDSKNTMSSQDFTSVFMVDKTPKEAFDAINNVRGWWSGNIEGNTDKLGEEWTYRYEDIHYSKQKITEMIPDKKVVWTVLDSYLNFVKDKTEWNGTKITFDIGEKDGKTEVRFTHMGLVPAYECYDDCSNAWGFYMGSLKSLINKGKGKPNPAEKAKSTSATKKKAKRTPVKKKKTKATAKRKKR